MSTTLSTSAMVTKLQQKFPIGILSAQWMDFLNEAFRKINQMSKGGFIWQLKNTNIVVPTGTQVGTALPTDFDPGKSAFLSGPVAGTATLIPYKSVEEFMTEQDFQTLTGIGMFSCWTFRPTFTFGPPTSYLWAMWLAPNTAFPIGVGGITLNLWYHAMNYAPLTAASNVFFPTPDQFDSLVLDLAEAEARREYTASGWEKLAASATQSLNEMIDTYRTDRYNLAGLSDTMAQAQEKNVMKDK